MEDQDSKLMKLQERQLFFSKLTAVFTGSILAVAALTVCILVPRTIVTLKSANNFITDARDALDTVTEDLNSLTDEFTKFIKEDASAITDASKGIGSVDFEGLNDAIHALEDAVEPFANLMNRFRN